MVRSAACLLFRSNLLLLSGNTPLSCRLCTLPKPIWFASYAAEPCARPRSFTLAPPMPSWCFRYATFFSFVARARSNPTLPALTICIRNLQICTILFPKEEACDEDETGREEVVLASGNIYTPPFAQAPPVQEWRTPRNSVSTNHAILCLCLNIGIDPPGIKRPDDRGRLLCWMEPDLEEAAKSGSDIKDRLLRQYNRWHPHCKFKAIIDPTVPDLSRMCRQARRHARAERVLFHYNGYAVPRPTETGELWMFNTHYTKYIPMNFSDLLTLLAGPGLYIFDCDRAALLIEHYHEFVATRDEEVAATYENHAEFEERVMQREENPHPDDDCVILAAVGPEQDLPTDPNLPADLFTSCLTTPIRTALMFHASRSMIKGITMEMIDKMPGDMGSNQTPLGDLARIFTTLTDSIAWSTMKTPLFRRLFRQDLLLASMMRNFLLACRLLSFYDLQPESYPRLPHTANHPLWDVFEYTIDQYFAQLVSNFRMQQAAQADAEYGARVATTEELGAGRAMLLREEAFQAGYVSSYRRYRIPFQAGQEGATGPLLTHNLQYQSSSFFEDQIKGFEIGLNIGDPDTEQLPILLLLLIQKQYRLRGVILLCRYLELQRRAVELALIIGIFPYMSSFLSKPPLRTLPYLVLIWGKILAYDPKCVADLERIKAQHIFISFLQPSHGGPRDTPTPTGVQLAVALFNISVFAEEARLASDCRAHGALTVCLHRMSHPDPLTRRWACLCLTQIVKNCSHDPEFSAGDLRRYVGTIRTTVLVDKIADIRAAGIAALAQVLYQALRLWSPSKSRPPMVEETRTPPRRRTRPADYGAADHEEDEGNRSVPPPLNRTRSSHSKSRTPPRQTPAVSIHSPPQRSLSAQPGPSRHGISSPLRRVTDGPQPELYIFTMVCDVLARFGLYDSSVLVRREVATALALMYKSHAGAFVKAARELVDNKWPRFEYGSKNPSSVRECFVVLFQTMVELRFDPHPVVALCCEEAFTDIFDKAGLYLQERRASPNRDTDVDDGVGSFDSHRSDTPDDRGPAPQVIHVRSSSGHFNLSLTGQGRGTARIPRTNSASLLAMHDVEAGQTPNALSSHFPGFLTDETETDSPPVSRLISGVKDLLFRGSRRSIEGGLRSREGSMLYMDQVGSPNRFQRRSQSYQVIPPTEIDSLSESHSSHNLLNEKAPVEQAADSLYAWSKACVIRIAFECDGPDHMPVPDPKPQYTKLWDSILNPKEGVDPAAFPIIADGAPPVEKHSNLKQFLERKTFQMGAGGGAVMSLSFLPREVGREGDQYIVTGDSMGAIGVYDALNGECQSSFGIPGAPGMVKCDVTSVLCLNGRDSDGGVLNIAQQTPLILAGSFDGRVAVYRSDLVNKKYSVLSAWQASGPSLMGSLRLGGESFQRRDRSHFGIFDNKQRRGVSETTGDMLRRSGNGLVVGFRSFNSSLCTAGCDGNVMKVWDVDAERCTWSDDVVAPTVWPLTISVPPWEGCRDIAVVGASDGTISLVDTRARKAQTVISENYRSHKCAIVSLAHRNRIEAGYGEAIVSADCEGEIMLWDLRVSETAVTTLRKERAPIRAHTSSLTTMAAHPNGNYIASGSTAKCVKVFGVDTPADEHLMIRNRWSPTRKGVMERIMPVSLAFHQQEYALAFGCSDGTVTMYGTEL